MFMFDDEDGVLEAMEENVAQSKPTLDKEPSQGKRKRFSMDWDKKTIVEDGVKGLKKERKAKKSSQTEFTRKKKSGKSKETVNEVLLKSYFFFLVNSV